MTKEIEKSPAEMAAQNVTSLTAFLDEYKRLANDKDRSEFYSLCKDRIEGFIKVEEQLADCLETLQGKDLDSFCLTMGAILRNVAGKTIGGVVKLPHAISKLPEVASGAASVHLCAVAKYHSKTLKLCQTCIETGATDSNANKLLNNIYGHESHWNPNYHSERSGSSEALELTPGELRLYRDESYGYAFDDVDCKEDPNSHYRSIVSSRKNHANLIVSLESEIARIKEKIPSAGVATWFSKTHRETALVKVQELEEIVNTVRTEGRGFLTMKEWNTVEKQIGKFAAKKTTSESNLEEYRADIATNSQLGSGM